MQSGNPSQKIFYFLLTGPSGAGKSSAVIQYTQNLFYKRLKSTIGVEFDFTDIPINDENCRLAIYDASGHPRFQKLITERYLPNKHAILIFFDVTSQASFDQVDAFIAQAKNVESEHCQIYLVGAQIDLLTKRKISFDIAKQKAASYDIPYTEVSAKKNKNINFLFNEIARLIYQREFPTAGENLQSKTEWRLFIPVKAGSLRKETLFQRHFKKIFFFGSFFAFAVIAGALLGAYWDNILSLEPFEKTALFLGGTISLFVASSITLCFAQLIRARVTTRIEEAKKVLKHELSETSPLINPSFNYRSTLVGLGGTRTAPTQSIPTSSEPVDEKRSYVEVQIDLSQPTFQNHRKLSQ